MPGAFRWSFFVSCLLQFENEDEDGEHVADGDDQVGKQKGILSKEIEEALWQSLGGNRISVDGIGKTSADERRQHDAQTPPDLVEDHAWQKWGEVLRV